MEHKTKTVEVSITSKIEEKMIAGIDTYSGLILYYNTPTEDAISIIDIAHALSNICRFTGHTKEFYSVAQHSVLVSNCQNTLEEQRAGLLHDATEAYVNDLPSPLKNSGYLDDYKILENRIHDVINDKYNINDGMTPNIKKADLKVLITEKRDVVNTKGVRLWDWAKDIDPLEEVIIPLGPKEAKALFIQKFIELFPYEAYNEFKDEMI